MLKKPVVEISPNTWLLSEYLLVNAYLLVGEEKALLIDCGVGIGNIAQTVQNLTEKPLTVVITHGHFDHDGGAALFEEVLMHPDDFALSEQGYAQGEYVREWYAKTRGPVRNPDASPEELLSLVQKNGPVVRKPLRDGQVFDLGGRTVEAIHTPGHSLGSMCFLDKENRLLFTGDMANDSLLLNCGDSSTSVEGYYNSMSRVWSRRLEYDAICLGHDAIDVMDKTIISDYLMAAQLLMSGAATGAKSENSLHSGTGYRYNERTLIWYQPEKLKEAGEV